MSLGGTIERDFRAWLDFLNDIRSVGVDDDFGIPQIAVIGDQSSGKSSLLNSLTGIPFPRGAGLVTRCPTVIAMQGIQKDSDNVGDEWKAEVSIISNARGKIVNSESYPGTGLVSNADELASRISRLTDALTRSSKSGFSRDSIFVKVEATGAPNLILVDLPGIIRTTTAGQSHTVIREVDELLEHFMRQPRTIILAIVPANQDIATVDVLERAQRVDPTGKRTIGVLTKPDLVDAGAEEEVLKIINNQKKPLALGYVMVKNRNQAQLLEETKGISPSILLKDALAEEEKYFSTHAKWSRIDASRRGTGALSKKLTQCLVTQAKEALPFMKWELEQRDLGADAELSDLGEGTPTSSIEMRDVLMQMVSRFGQTLRRISTGDYRDEVQLDANADDNTPTATAATSEPKTTVNASKTASSVVKSTTAASKLRIKYFVTEITQTLRERIAKKVPDFDSEEYTKMLEDTLSSMRGRELPGFMSARMMMGSVSVDIEAWRLEVEDALNSVLDVFTSTAFELANRLAGRYPKIRDALMSVVEGCCSLQTAELARRAEEIFERGAGGAINDQEMAASINQIRFERFDRMFQDVLRIAAPGSKEATAARNPTAKECKADPTDADKEALRKHVLTSMGKHYMEYHSVGKGHLEEARAALRAYWRISESRLFDDVVSCLDIILLQRGSELIEQTLLSEAQNWVENPQTLSELLTEETQVTVRRADLKEKRKHIQAALQRIRELDPECISKSPLTGNVHRAAASEAKFIQPHVEYKKAPMVSQAQTAKPAAATTVAASTASKPTTGHSTPAAASNVLPSQARAAPHSGSAPKPSVPAPAAPVTAPPPPVRANNTPPATAVSTATPPAASAAPVGSAGPAATAGPSVRKAIHAPPQSDATPNSAPLNESELRKLREEPSEPEYEASARNDGSIAVFNLARGCTEEDCFMLGLIYWLGTVSYIRSYRNPMSFGQLNIQSSGMALGEESVLSSRIIREVSTKNDPGCWICIDVGRTRAISPTYIAVRHGSPHPGKDIINWALQGRDIESGGWIPLATLPVLPSRHAAKVIAVNVAGQKFSQLRVVSTGVQQDGTHALHVCSVELYGTFYRIQR